MNDACNHSSLALATVTPLVGVDTIGFDLDINGQRMRHVASLQDQVVRDQLVAAGWTPPDASLADVPGIPWPRAAAFKPAAHQSGVDWHGLALELTAEAQRAPSQTMVRAMDAAANGLRLMGQHGTLPLDPVLLEVEAALEVAVARIAKDRPGASKTSEHLGLAAVRAALAGTIPAYRRVQTREARVSRVYVAGPMTGLPEFNFPAFNAASAMLRAQGLHVENPAEHGIVDGAEWADYLHYDLGRLATCSEIHLLPGWSNSRGAALEALCAHTLGMTITYGFGAERMELVDALQVVQSMACTGSRAGAE